MRERIEAGLNRNWVSSPGPLAAELSLPQRHGVCYRASERASSTPPAINSSAGEAVYRGSVDGTWLSSGALGEGECRGWKG